MVDQSRTMKKETSTMLPKDAMTLSTHAHTGECDLGFNVVMIMGLQSRTHVVVGWSSPSTMMKMAGEMQLPLSTRWISHGNDWVSSHAVV